MGKSGERGYGIPVLPAQHDDDDDDKCLVRIIISYLKPYYCVEIICIRKEYLISHDHMQKTLKKQLHIKT